MPATRQSVVVVPSIGKSASALPTARLSATFFGLTPWVICRMTGSTSQRCQNLRLRVAFCLSVVGVGITEMDLSFLRLETDFGRMGDPGWDGGHLARKRFSHAGSSSGLGLYFPKIAYRVLATSL